MITKQIAKLDALIAELVSRLDHARKHGGNVAKWQDKIERRLEIRNRLMVMKDNLPEGKAPTPSDKMKFRFVRPERSYKRFANA